jgi:hypothetical protein
MPPGSSSSAVTWYWYRGHNLHLAEYEEGAIAIISGHPVNARPNGVTHSI